MQIRVGKPQRHRDGFRCMLSVSGTGYRAWGPYSPTREGAIQRAEAAASAGESEHRSVGEAIGEYIAHAKDRGLRPRSLEAMRWRLVRMLPDPDALVMSLREQDLKKRVAELRATLSYDTVFGFLHAARHFCAWCIEQGWLRANPCDGVKLLGRKRKGKMQLRIHEARRLWAVALEQARAGDDGAMAVLIAVGCALRTSEIITRTVRDLDDDGRVLWIEAAGEWQTKSAAGKRSVDVPDELRPLLLARCVGKLPAAPLLVTQYGKQPVRQWVNEHVHRLCAVAGIQQVCAHSLRGLHATIAIEQGMSPRVVAATLGHESPEMTLSHYAQPGSDQAATRRAALKVLRGDR